MAAAQLAVLAAALSYALASAWGKVALAGQPPVLNALGMLTGSTVLLLPLAVWAEGVPRLDLPLPVWGALAGLAAVPLAWGMWRLNEFLGARAPAPT